MESKKSVGDIGENEAARYLKKEGFKILKRNYWKPWGEVDIIAKRRDGLILFIEVKTMLEVPEKSSGIKPEDQVTHSKLRKMKKAALAFAGNNSDLIKEDIGWRIDLIAVILDSQRNKKSLRHYENIV